MKVKKVARKHFDEAPSSAEDNARGWTNGFQLKIGPAKRITRRIEGVG